MNNKSFSLVTKLVKIFSKTANIKDVKKSNNKLTVSVNITKDEYNKLDSTCEYDIIVKSQRYIK